MSYFLIIKTEWVFDSQEFSRQLRTRWSEVLVKEVQNLIRENVLDFEIPMSETTLYGSLNRKCNAVIFHVGLKGCSVFAHWCRALIPPSEEVVFCDESMTIHFELKPGMSPTDIIQAIRSSES